MRLWRQLNQNCGLEGIFNYPNPHFTWFSAEMLEVERCEPIIEVIAQDTAAFDVHSSGLGFFDGEDPGALPARGEITSINAPPSIPLGSADALWKGF